MKQQTVKTTLEIDETLFYMLKQRALDTRTSMKEVVHVILTKNLIENKNVKDYNRKKTAVESLREIADNAYNNGKEDVAQHHDQYLYGNPRS